MSVIRAFIAVDIPPEIQARLEKIIEQFKGSLPGGGVRWVNTESLHLTLKFLGDVSIANLEMLDEILKGEASRHHHLEISIGGLGAFPSLRRPRVIWAGVEAPAELSAVQSGIENEMARLGYSREERPFSPHLTLGRISRNATPAEIQQIGNLLSKTKVGFLGAARISAVHLYQSDLRPEGSVYTRLFTAPLLKQ